MEHRGDVPARPNEDVQSARVESASGWAGSGLLENSELALDELGRLVPKSINTPPFVSSFRRSFESGLTFDSVLAFDGDFTFVGLCWFFIVEAPCFSVVDGDDPWIIAENFVDSTCKTFCVNSLVQPNNHRRSDRRVTDLRDRIQLRFVQVGDFVRRRSWLQIDHDQAAARRSVELLCGD